MKTYKVNYNKNYVDINTDDLKIFPKAHLLPKLGISDFNSIEDLKEQLLGEDLPEGNTRLSFYEEGDKIEFWLTIDEDELRQKLKEELKNALDFDLSGWRIPIYVDVMTGKITSGNWLSQGSYQPDAFEFYKIEPWSIDWEEHLEEGETKESITEIEKDEIIDDQLDELEHFHISQIKERKIPELNKDAEYNNEMSEKEDFYIQIE